MQIQSINFSKPSFSSYTPLGADDSGYDFDNEMSKIRDLDNLDIPSKKSENDKKNVLEAGITLTGALLAAFVAGKAITLTADKFFPNIMKSVTSNASKLSNKINEIVSTAIAGEKTPKIVKKALSGSQSALSNIYKHLSKSGKPQETMANVVGTGFAAASVPSILTADDNNNGIKDFADKSQSVYSSITGNMKILKNLLDIPDIQA